MYEILHTPSYWRSSGSTSSVRLWARSTRSSRHRADVSPASIRGAITGHSFGVYTSQLFAGAEIDLPGEGTRSLTDKRFAAAILLSAQGRDQQGLRKGSWDGIDGPHAQRDRHA